MLVDGTSTYDSGELVINITGSNDAPVANADTLGAIEDTPIIFTASQLLGNDTDVDAGATRVLHSVANGTGGTAVLNSNGTVTFTPNANFNGAATFSYEVRDDMSVVSGSATVTVNVTAVNDAPTITSGGGAPTLTVGVLENGTAVTTVTSSDVEGSVGYALSGADASRFTISAAGVLAFIVAPDFENPTDAGGNNVYDVVVTASDGSLGDTQTLAVVVGDAGRTIAGTKKADKFGLDKPAGKGTTDTEDFVNGKGGDDTIAGAGGNDTIRGGAGRDSLDGGAGIDTVDFGDMTKSVVLTLNGKKVATANVGGVADDTLKNFENIIGGKGNDTLTGDKLANILLGGKGNDTLDGGKGNDTLDGGVGKDVLKGGKGADHFVFSSKVGAANADTVSDFKHGEDKISLDAAIFAAIGGMLDAGEFRKGLAAKDADDRIVYDSKTGKLFYDADGKGGAAALHFATLSSKPTLDHGDFAIV